MVVAVLGEEALGVELNALDGQGAVAQAHQLAAVDRTRRWPPGRSGRASLTTRLW